MGNRGRISEHSISKEEAEEEDQGGQAPGGSRGQGQGHGRRGGMGMNAARAKQGNSLTTSGQERKLSVGNGICSCMRAKSFRSCQTLCDPMDCSPPGSGILQARILEWIAMTSSRGSSLPRGRT